MNNTNPWIGLNSYQEGQVLYGRSREIQDLSMSVFYNRQTVVYGKSGIGKSSLLHAGIFPMARLRGCLPISVRFDHASELSYRQQLMQRITEAVLAAGGEMEDSSKDSDTPKSLWEFFHRMQPQKEGQIITPLIVIDQFEEIFTLSKNTQPVRAFFDELADLFNNVMPEYLNSDNALQKAEETGSIFDGLSVSSTSRFEQEMSYHIVFVLREDYLSYLERYAAHIPALKQNHYGLLPITYQQAMEIITKPCEGLVSAEVADAIIRHITTEQDINDETPVDSAILSLYLSRLFVKKKDALTISMQLVKEQGDVLIEDFYAEVVATIERKTIEYLEDVLINTDGHRENVTMESLYKQVGIDPSAIASLERAHLLRIFSYGNAQRVEFAHDVLCPIIVRRRSQRQNIARMRKVQRTGIMAMLALVVLLFSSLYIIAEREDSKASIAKQQTRLSQMEVSLIEKGAQKMLDNHDIYGAIQLLINSMDDNEQYPSEKTARLERILRQSVDSLYYSKDLCVSHVNYLLSLNFKLTAVASDSKKLVGFNDDSGIVVIIDSYTGSIVQFISKHPVDQYNGVFANMQNWKSWINNNRIKYTNNINDTSVMIVDIHPDDSRCLVIADDTTLLDCFIYKDKRLIDDYYGYTRLCLHDIHVPIQNASYNRHGNEIAVLLKDSSYVLYDGTTGNKINTDEHICRAQEIIDKVKNQQYYLLKEDDHYLRKWYDIPIDESVIIHPSSVRTIDIMMDTLYRSPSIQSEIYLHECSQEEKAKIQAHLDTLPLPLSLRHFKRSFCLDEEGNETDIRYYWPIGINKNANRVVVCEGMWREDTSVCLKGIYARTGNVFFDKTLSYEVHTLHFTEDDQYLVVNYGEETQEVIYLPPLEQLVDSCKNMFFDWQMTEEERYQTYIHMND